MDSIVTLDGINPLGRSILQALGVPIDFLEATITLTNEEHVLLDFSSDFDASFDLCKALEDEGILEASVSQKQWPVKAFSGYITDNNQHSTLAELMFHIAIDYKNIDVALTLLNVLVQEDVEIGEAMLERLLVLSCKKGPLGVTSLILNTWECSAKSLTTGLEILIADLPRGSSLDPSSRHAIELLLSAGANPNASHPPQRYGHGFLLARQSLESLPTRLIFSSSIERRSSRVELCKLRWPSIMLRV